MIQCLGYDRKVHYHGGDGAQHALDALLHHLEEVALQFRHLLIDLLLLQYHLVALLCLVGQALLQHGLHIKARFI